LLKASHIIPPALALVAVACWNVSQWRAVSDESGRVRKLAERIQAAKSTPVSMTSARSFKSKAPLAEGPIDWKHLASKMMEMQESGGMGDVRTMIAFQKRITTMGKEELLAALEEIAGLDLAADQKELLEQLLVSPLIEKDPELALTTFANRIPVDDDGVAWQLSSALAAWAKMNPAAASAWFDRQIAAGLFESKSLDGQSPTRTEFEAAMTGVLLDSDVAGATRRIAALPEDQRREALEQISFSDLSPGGQKAYAELVRGLIPQDERAGSFSHVISELIPDGGYAKVDAFLNDIQATPEERIVSAREAANSQLEEIAGDRDVTRQDVDAMREWLKRQAPGTEDQVTGEALADAAQEGGEFGFAEASKLALEYHKSSGNDDVLVAFLESFAARSNLEEALPLADQITDPARREAILNRLR
jgi:hypothetical protein